MFPAIAQYVIGGFIGWVLHEAITFYFHRRNLRTYLTIAISAQISVDMDNLNMLSKYLSDNVKLGSAVTKVPPRYIASDLEMITSVREQMVQHLTSREVSRLATLLFALEDMESLTEGICIHLDEYAKSSMVVSEHQYSHLEDHLKKMSHICVQLPKKIEKIDDLPASIDYLVHL